MNFLEKYRVDSDENLMGEILDDEKVFQWIDGIRGALHVDDIQDKFDLDETTAVKIFNMYTIGEQTGQVFIKS